MAKYKLGKNALLTAPGVSLDNVVDVDLNASGDEVDITVFGDTEKQIGCGLLDVTVEVTATQHSATVGATTSMLSQSDALLLLDSRHTRCTARCRRPIGDRDLERGRYEKIVGLSQASSPSRA